MKMKVKFLFIFCLFTFCSTILIADTWKEKSYDDFSDGLFRETALKGPGVTADIRLGEFNTWYDPFWGIRRAVLVDNRSNSSELSNFQTKVEIPYYTGMNSNFADIRFTTTNGSTYIPYWIQEFTAESSAIVWLKIPTIAGSDITKVYLYYDNLGTGTTSNGEDTFIVFDDFNNGLDTNKWSALGTGISTSNNFLRIMQDNPFPPSSITMLDRIPYQFIMERKARVYKAPDYDFYGGTILINDTEGIGAIRYSDDLTSTDGLLYQNTDSFYIEYNDTASSPLQPFWQNIWFNEQITYNGETGTLFYYREKETDSETLTYDIGTTPSDEEIFMIFHAFGRGSGHYHDMDDIRIRQYTETEPSTGIDIPQTESVGAFVTDGSYYSGIYDTLALGTQIDSVSWDATEPGTTSITIQIRASDNLFEMDDDKPDWSDMTNGGDPPIAGRYIQYRAILSGTGTYSPELEDITITYTTVNPLQPSLTAVEGSSNPGASNEQSGASDLEMLQIMLTAGTTEPIKIKGITFTTSGTGKDDSEILSESVKLYNDVNGDGIMDSGDTLLATGNFSEDDGTLTFSGLTFTINQGDSEYLLLTYDLADTTTFGDTFLASIQKRSDISAIGTISGEAPSLLGNFPLNGGTKTVASSGSFTVSLSSTTPEAQNIDNDDLDVVVASVHFDVSSVEGIELSGIKFTASGSGNDAQDIQPNGLQLILDANKNGLYDSGETKIGYNQSFLNDDGTTTFTFSETIPANGSADWLVIYDFSGNGVGGNTYEISIASATDITAVGQNSAASITPNGSFPITSSTVSLNDIADIVLPETPIPDIGSTSSYCFISHISVNKFNTSGIFVICIVFIGTAFLLIKKFIKY